MSYAEDLKLFTAAHTCQSMTVNGSRFRYVLSGKKDARTIVLLNGGMNTLFRAFGGFDEPDTGYRGRF